jgi:hypothetical protein
MDPFAGNLQDPVSLHKYLYCAANPVNAIDATGRTWTILGTMRNIGLCALVFMGVYGSARVAKHWYEAGSFIQGVKDADAEFTGGILIRCEIDGAEAWHLPSTILRKYKDDIRTAAAREGIPPAMLAGVLYTEMKHYALHDWATSWDLAPNISTGPAQLEREDVRRWVSELAGKSDTELYNMLMDPGQAIPILAKVLRTFKSWPYGGQAIEGYLNASTKDERALWSGRMNAVKDKGEGDPSWDLERADWVEFGRRSYMRALKIVPDLGE